MQKVTFAENQVLHFPGVASELVGGVTAPDANPSHQQFFDTWDLLSDPLRDFLIAQAAELQDQLPKPAFGRWVPTTPSLAAARDANVHTDPGTIANINVTVAADKPRRLFVNGLEIEQNTGDLVVIMGGFTINQTCIVGASLPPHSVVAGSEGGLFANIGIVNPGFTDKPN